MHLALISMCLGWLWHDSHCVQLNGSTDYATWLQQQLQSIRLERDYETVVIYGRAPCVFHELLPQLQRPAVLLGTGSSRTDWRFSSESLLLSCGSAAEQERNGRTALRLQLARRLVHLEPGAEPAAVCQAHFAREQFNVAMVDAGRRLYSCRFFHQPNYVPGGRGEAIYVQQFANMRGAAIRSEIDQIGPRGLLYRNPSTGQLKMVGFVAELVNAFVQRVNATLKLRDDIEVGQVLHHENFTELRQRGEIDIAALLLTTIDMENMDTISYPYVFSSLCFMIPLPQHMAYREIFAFILQPAAAMVLLLLCLIFSLLFIYSERLNWQRFSLMELLLNDRCLRGLLGHPFPLPDRPGGYLKGVCMLTCFAGLIVTTMYESYLQAYMTNPPLKASPHNLEQMFASRYTIVLERKDTNHWLGQNSGLTSRHVQQAYVLDHWKDIIQLRNTFDTNYIFEVTAVRWFSYQEQQRHFRRPLFFYSEDVCVQRLIMLCLPLRDRLPYRQLFEEHMQYMQEFGLTKLWKSTSFSDMVKHNLTTLHDYSVPEPYEDQLYVRDLTHIFAFYALAHTLAGLCFAIECCWPRIRGRLIRVRVRVSFAAQATSTKRKALSVPQ